MTREHIDLLRERESLRTDGDHQCGDCRGTNAADNLYEELSS
jgi:hypothetical protein